MEFESIEERVKALEEQVQGLSEQPVADQLRKLELKPGDIVLCPALDIENLRSILSNSAVTASIPPSVVFIAAPDLRVISDSDLDRAGLMRKPKE